MTAVEVTVLHVVAEAEEVVLSSSSKFVNIIAEKDVENKKENLCSVVNRKTVKEGTDSDGSYAGINGNDAIHGGPVELNHEKNRNCVDEEDGEVKSESDSVRGETCIGTGDQEEEEEPIELCDVERAVDEQETRDLVEDDPASAVDSEDGVSETSIAAHSVVSESPEDHVVIDLSVEISAVSDCNGDGLVEQSFEEEEAVMIKDSIDSSPNSLEVVKPCDIVEIGPSSVEGGKSSGVVETITSSDPGAGAGAFVLAFGSFPLMLNNVSVGCKSGVNGIMTHDDPKIETETIKSDENNEGVSRDISSGSILFQEVEDRADGNSVASISHPDSDQIQVLTNGGIRLGNSVGDVERKMPFNYLIKVPRYNDENLKEQIRLAHISVDERTRSLDAIRIQMQSMRATCKEYGNDFNAAVSQERKARDLHRSKRQEIESLQSVMDIEDIDVKIQNLERTIQHEPLTLKVEKNFIRDIKQLKQTREKLSSTMDRQDEMQQGLDQKECLKFLKKEADQLKDNVLMAEVVTKAAKRKYYDASEKLNNFQSQFNAADGIRQEAYAQLQSLKKQSYEKSKHFWQYREDLNTANDLASKRGEEALHSFCTDQVEKFMNLWNNNDEFRKEYTRCNARSTIRRLRTLDGRALGPNEASPVIPRVVNERVANDHAHAVSGLTWKDPTQEKVVLAKAEKEIDKPVEQKEETSKSRKPVETDEVGEETKEEEEAARKAEEMRKKEDAAKLREQLGLEEIATAKEALERKRRKAEKAQARDAEKALKEAEKKEKEREKRERKKERRKAAMAAGDASNTSITDEAGFTPTAETLVETPTAVQQMPQNPKQIKAKPIPPPLRNQGRRRMQPWMWVILTCLVIYALFLIGNYV